MVREIPRKNYVVFAILCVFTIFIVFYLVNIYKTNLDFNNKNNNIMIFLSEIKPEEFDNYIMDNHDTIIYLSSSVDNDNRIYEEKLKKYINKKNLSKDIIYLDVANLDLTFFEELKRNHLSKKLENDNVDLNVSPNVLIIKGEKIVQVLYKQTKKPNIEETKKFIDKYWISE